MNAKRGTAEPSMRLLHTMLRVGDLDRSVAFYTERLGMRLFRKESYPEDRFTLAFVGYGEETTSSAIELTWNWDRTQYAHGTGFGHIALAVEDAEAFCARLEAVGVPIVRAPGPMRARSPDRDTAEIIAFIEDPDGYRIELIETSSST
jgi:lactoylglutathione lyase